MRRLGTIGVGFRLSGMCTTWRTSRPSSPREPRMMWMTSLCPRVVTRPTRAPRFCTIAFVPTVVPWDTSAVFESSAETGCPHLRAAAARAFMRPSAKSPGVDGAFALTTRPPSSTITQSVNVPPMSRPQRNWGMVSGVGLRCRSGLARRSAGLYHHGRTPNRHVSHARSGARGQVSRTYDRHSASGPIGAVNAGCRPGEFEGEGRAESGEREGRAESGERRGESGEGKGETRGQGTEPFTPGRSIRARGRGRVQPAGARGAARTELRPTGRRIPLDHCIEVSGAVALPPFRREPYTVPERILIEGGAEAPRAAISRHPERA